MRHSRSVFGDLPRREADPKRFGLFEQALFASMLLGLLLAERAAEDWRTRVLLSAGVLLAWGVGSWLVDRRRPSARAQRSAVSSVMKDLKAAARLGDRAVRAGARRDEPR